MTAKETKEILTILHVDTGKLPSAAKVQIWAKDLERVPYGLGFAAARRMRATEKIYGEPAWQDYRKHVNALYRAARALGRGFKKLDPAARSRMSSKDVDKYDALIKDIETLRKSPAIVQWATRKLEHNPSSRKEKIRNVDAVRKSFNSNSEAHHIVQMALGEPTPKKQIEEDEIIAGNDDQRFILKSEVING